MNITTVSVTVMRSHDYCHFSVTLGAEQSTSLVVEAGAPGAIVRQYKEKDPITLEDIDGLRKEAARLADKAVEQYKIAKANQYRLAREKRDRSYELREIKSIKEMPETDRTPEQQAKLKTHADEVYEAGRRFDYQDQWDDDEAED